MAETKIEWATYTFNPWLGCSKVSPACTHCYAESWAKRSGLVQWGDNPRRKTTNSYWRQPLKWNAQAEGAPIRPRVFCASLADVFEDRAELLDYRAQLFALLIKQTPNLDWLLLTKRPENIKAMLPDDWGTGYQNVWLGTTAENQRYAEERIPELLTVPAKIRFLSLEPLLGPIDLNSLSDLEHHEERYYSALRNHVSIDWVIVGGESGGGARPMEAQWVRWLRGQCRMAGVKFLFKQWGEFSAEQIRVGKHQAGRSLDGRTWDEFPVVQL